MFAALGLVSMLHDRDLWLVSGWPSFIQVIVGAGCPLASHSSTGGVASSAESSCSRVSGRAMVAASIT